MNELGKVLMIAGVALCTLGALFLLLGRSGIQVGRLPGDVVYRGKHTTFYFPLMTSILLSALLSLVLYLLSKFRR